MIALPVQRILGSFPALFFVFNQQLQLVYVNANAGCLLGYGPAGLTGTSLASLVAEADLPQLQRAISTLKEGNSSHGVVARLRHQSGALISFTWHMAAEEGSGHIYALCQQVPYAKEDHQLSGNTLGRNRTAHEAMLEVDEAFRVRTANDALADLLGRPAEILKKSTLWTCLPDLQESAFETTLKAGMAQKIPVRFECFCPSLQGVWLEVAAFPNHDGLCIFLRNMDEEKKAEAERWRLSLVAQQTTNIVVLTDACGQITWVNNAFTRIMGYEFTEAMGEPMATFLNGQETDMATTLYLQEAIKNEEPFEAEVLHYSKQGEKVWVELQGKPIKGSHGKTEQFFCLQTVITKRKEFEEKLQQEQQQRQRKITRATIEAQERERSLVSQELHDNVNQVLTTVKLYTELCLSGIDQQAELLRKSVALLQQSINDIRSLSKRLSAPTLGKIRLRDSVKELTDTIAATNRLHIDTDLQLLDQLEVPQDLHLAIYRILQEHFTNILKHASARNVQVMFETVNDELVLKVRDDGKGFNTHELSGGIGIANMLTRAESMKGTLTLNSAPGLGCVLLVRFPVS